MTAMGMPQMTQATGGGRLSGELYKVVELILDRGLVIDVFVRVSVMGSRWSPSMRGSSLPASMLTCASPRCVAAWISPAAAPGSAARWPAARRRWGYPGSPDRWLPARRVRKSPWRRAMSSYVYCVTSASHPLPLEGAVGVGEHSPALRLVRERDLVAVVSDAPENLRPKRRDLVKHDAVIGQMCAAGPVLPMRFGTVAPDDEAVQTELRSGARRYGELLSRIDGHVELNVKGAHAEEALLRDVLLQNDELRARNHALRAAGGGDHQDKVAFGEHVAAAVEEQRARDAGQIIARLQPHAAQVRRGPPVDGCFVNVSFLVASSARPDFDRALSRLRRELPGYASVELYGPLPPYSFVGNEADA